MKEKYRNIKTIGEGGFGIVYEVENSEGNRFAKKQFSPANLRSSDGNSEESLKKRFKREVLTQQDLINNSILPVLDHDLGCEAPWFIMPLAKQTFKQKIKDDQFEGETTIDPLADILSGLQALHEEGYVHRDLNPNNILLHEGVWKLSDLGSVLPPSGATMTLTKDTVIFTESYCAPEQRKNFHSAQSPADIYSFGCILHDIFVRTERTPYAQQSGKGVIGIIIEKCTHQNPDKRPSLRKLRPMLLDALLEEGGHYQVEDKQSESWLERLKAVSEWELSEFEEFGRFFASLDIKEKESGREHKWVYSDSTPFLTRMPVEALEEIVRSDNPAAAIVVEKYCDWASSTAFEFNFSDSVCIRLNAIFDCGGPAFQACAFAALVQLGHTHNRWFVMRSMVKRCLSESISDSLARRLAIEIKTHDLEIAFKRCVLHLEKSPTDFGVQIRTLLDE